MIDPRFEVGAFYLIEHADFNGKTFVARMLRNGQLQTPLLIMADPVEMIELGFIITKMIKEGVAIK